MESRICNSDEVNIFDEKTCMENELPLPLPFPLDDAGEIELDDSHLEADDQIHRKEALLRQIIDDNSKTNDGGGQCYYTSRSSTDEPEHLGCLPSDVFVLICCSLTVREIASLATCSKSLYVASLNQDLWRAKFQARWNYDDPTIVDWSVAYRQAYLNPHDLWVTHWNCVEPCDGLGPGRCCIRETGNRRRTANTTSEKRSREARRCKKHRCPSCRYHPSLETENQSRDSSCKVATIDETEDGERILISTPAQAIQIATNLRLEESFHLLPCKPYSPTIAEQAFKKASTFHRFIDHHQYKDNSLYFLNDLLFFHVHDDHDDIDDEPFEMRDLKKRFDGNARADVEDSLSDSVAAEPALHSWHLANVCNPDYNRPIVWRILIQRSDCFTVFPSEGYLLPGESKVVTFGVKPFGSLLSHATHQVNVHRDAVDDVWASLHEKEARLPCTPFLFQYHYASNVPCRFLDDDSLSIIQQQQQQQQRVHTQEDPNSNSIQQPLLRQAKTANAPWKQCSIGHNQYIRSMYLEGHVHANYALSDFRRKTLVPFQLPSHQMSRTEKFIRRYLPRNQHLTYSMSPVVFCSPQLMEFYPSEWQRLQAIRLEEHRNNSVAASKYRTESACEECGLTWGPRMEELGQAFVLAKLEMETMFQGRRARIRNLHRLLECLLQEHRNDQFCLSSNNTKSLMVRNQLIIKHLRRKVMNYRGALWLSRTESRILLQWEILLDLLSSGSNSNEGTTDSKSLNSNVHRGVYRFPTCTDSVFDKNSRFDRSTSDLLIHSDMITWKNEPSHLHVFSTLAFTPGKLCFPHKDRSQDTLPRSYKDGIMTDTFLDDPISGLKAALSVVADPRSLLIHGLFDQVSFPGEVSRRPRLPILPALNERECLTKIRKQCQPRFDPFIKSQAQLAYYELQQSLDIQVLLFLNSFNVKTSSYSISLRYFIQNIPPPGIGRFALNTTEHHIDRTFWFLEKPHGRITEFHFEEKLHGLAYSDCNKQEPDVGIFSQQSFDPSDIFVFPQLPGANNHGLARGPRLFSIIRSFSSQFGWRTGSNHDKGSVYVARRILIAAQCFSLALTLVPISVTLFGRYFRLIPAIPTSYHLEGIPFEIENKMRFLTETECGYAGVFLVLIHCCLHRWIERHCNRHFFRAMGEHMPQRQERHLLRRLKSYVFESAERIWDAACPLALQRILFLPRWNRRKYSEFLGHLSYWRSEECKERESTIRAVSASNGISPEERDKSIMLRDNGIAKKILAGVAMILFGFLVSSPHFFLNFLAVFACSMSLGISVSLQSVETGRQSFTISSAGSAIESMSIITAVIFGLLVGQLTGGSGGVLFLVEFVFTFVSLVLGGMGTISASGMRCWGTFFCLFLVSFWGYIFGRSSVIGNISKKKSGTSSVMLCGSLVFVLYFSLMSIAGWRWEKVVDILIERPKV